MNKKKMIITIILTILILFGIYMLYNTFAISTIVINDSNNIYDVKVGEGTSISVGKGSNKTIYFHIENVNKGSIKYGVGYNTNTNIEVLVYDDSVDKTIDVIGYGENKFIKLYLNNPTDSDSTVTISTVLGYENGGDLIIPDGITLVTEVLAPPKQTTLADYITNLYVNASKTKAQNNGIEYNYASSESLMNDRLGGTTTDLDGGNIRYYGASPNNYIYFNCEEYPDTNCEKWRIIGVFNNQVKIIRSESIGQYSWDSSKLTVNLGKGANEWSQADAMKLLNPGYESESVGGSLYYSSSSGKCYSGSSNATSSCDFTSSGIKNDATSSKIAEVIWNTGGTTGASSTSTGYSNFYYQKERGDETISDSNDNITRNTTWMGKVALAYPSDYGYATDFNECSESLVDYKSETNSYSCRANDWLYAVFGSSYNSWLLTPHTKFSYDVLIVRTGGDLNFGYITSPTHKKFNIVPTLFLNPTEIMVNGTTGAEDDPYKLKP